MKPTQLLLSKQEAADALSVSQRTIDKLITHNQLEVTRIGRRVLVTTEALRQLIRRDRPENS